jgi:hypothetical protein
MTHICTPTCTCTRTGQCILMDGLIPLHAQEALEELVGGVRALTMPTAQGVVVRHAVVVEEAVGPVHVVVEEGEGQEALVVGVDLAVVEEGVAVGAKVDKGFVSLAFF